MRIVNSDKFKTEKQVKLSRLWERPHRPSALPFPGLVQIVAFRFVQGGDVDGFAYLLGEVYMG